MLLSTKQARRRARAVEVVRRISEKGEYKLEAVRIELARLHVSLLPSIRGICGTHVNAIHFFFFIVTASIGESHTLPTQYQAVGEQAKQYGLW